MNWFWKYIFPALYGLLTYSTIRVINDTVAEVKFWERDWRLNTVEVTFCIFAGYVGIYTFRALFRRFDRKMPEKFGYKVVLKELFWIFIATELVNHSIVTPMAALTDDGLGWGDVAIICIIPLLFNLLYYTLIRSQKLLQAYINSKLQLEKVTNDHLQTELKFLKAQYHPHLLFNALNTIYFQMDESVAEAKKSVEKFSELLRYQLYDQQQTVPVSQEIHYLQNFIELQQVRSSEKLQLHVKFDPALNGQQVYPLLFLPLVENAFKYVGGDYKLCIEAKKKSNAIHFTVENSIPADYDDMLKEDPIRSKNKGIGLENLKRRLVLLYPGKHSFKTEKKVNSFLTEMKLEL